MKDINNSCKKEKPASQINVGFLNKMLMFS